MHAQEEEKQEVLEESKDQLVRADTRGGDAELDDKTHQNFKLLFGCKPSNGISAKSKMMEDFCRALEQSYDSNMICKLSDVLDSLIATDVNFEIISSQTAKPLLMIYDHNIVQKLKAYIFV